MGPGIRFKDQSILPRSCRINFYLLDPQKDKDRPQEVREADAEKRDERRYPGEEGNQDIGNSKMSYEHG